MSEVGTVEADHVVVVSARLGDVGGE